MTAVLITGPTVTQNSSFLPYRCSRPSPVLIVPTTEGLPGWVGLGGLVKYQNGIHVNAQPSQYWTGTTSTPTRYQFTTKPNRHPNLEGKFGMNTTYLVKVKHETIMERTWQITKQWNAVSTLVSGRQPAGKVKEAFRRHRPVTVVIACRVLVIVIHFSYTATVNNINIFTLLHTPMGVAWV